MTSEEQEVERRVREKSIDANALWTGNRKGASEKEKKQLEKLPSKHRLTKDDIAGTEAYKVRHLSQWCSDSEVEWYRAPTFERYSHVTNQETIIGDVTKVNWKEPFHPREYLRGGPREEIFFNPLKVKAAVVTCGGICPGLNSVIREVVMCLYYTYGVRDISGVQFGYEGFYKHEFVKLDPRSVSDIHHHGGTKLGTTRGGFDKDKIIDSIIAHGFTQVFIVGGDGTHRGAQALFDEVLNRKLKVAIVGIPKTIDNDVALIDRSFGFDSAVQEAVKAIESAHIEAKSTVNGVGLVVLMGRASGFITTYATLASGDVNACLIPEVKFTLDGDLGLLHSLKERLATRGHAVIVVAEGAGVDLFEKTEQRDKSGNLVLPEIGLFLKSRIKEYFKEEKVDVVMKYIDPSYMIRSVPANASDSVYTIVLSQNAVYGAMAGFSGFTVALINNHYCFIPVSCMTQTRKLDPLENRMWHRVLDLTGQPTFE